MHLLTHDLNPKVIKMKTDGLCGLLPKTKTTNETNL